MESRVQPKPLAVLKFAPIANANTGYCVGFKTLLPNREWAFSTLVRKSLTSFSAMAGHHLFIDIDTLNDDHLYVFTQFRDRCLRDSGLMPVVCFSSVATAPLSGLLDYFKHNDIPIAINHVGVIADEARLLIETEPDYAFIDSSIIRGIADDARRRVYLSNLINTLHTLGIEIIASGVDNEHDFGVCRDLSCEMAWGSYVQPPIETGDEAVNNFTHLTAEQEVQSNRTRGIDQRWIIQQLSNIPPISVDTPLKAVFERMAQTSDSAVIPLIERDGRPLGLLLEKTFKNLAYSAYGRDLMSNRGWGKSARDFVTRCPIADSTTPLDQMLAVYSSTEDAPGIIITNSGSYGGFLSTPSIIRAIHERTLARAQDENPLTRLPGNALIGEYLNERIGSDVCTTLAYLDFDNFKPFNDIYGFRQGDRAIMLFAQLLREAESLHGCFIGHIGGDDFFAGISHWEQDQAVTLVSSLIRNFSDDALSFYESEARAQGYIVGLDRDGNSRQFPLLSASAVVLTLPVGSKHFNVDDISATIAHYKKKSKASPDRIAIAPLVIPRSSSSTLLSTQSQTESA